MISLKTWLKDWRYIVNFDYIQRRLNPVFILGIIIKTFHETFFRNNPWFNFDSINILQDLIKPDDVLFEFGSGQSTKWFLDRVKFITSVENNRQWYVKIKNDLSGYEKKFNYIFAPNKSSYLNSISIVPDNSLDICIVDGAWRHECLIRCLPKIKTGGLLVLDNAEIFLPISWKSISFQKNWFEQGSKNSHLVREIVAKLSTWRMLATSDVSQDTLILVKK